MTSGASRRRLLLAVAVAACVVAVDQVTKTVAEDHLVYGLAGDHLVGPLWLTLTYNSGAAFGIGRGVTPVVEAVVAVLVVVLIVVAGRRAAHHASRTESVALGLVSGGALSNLADRAFRDHGGAVTDFINALQIGTHQRWPVFNVADACIVVGAFLLAASLFRSPRPVGATAGRTGGRDA